MFWQCNATSSPQFEALLQTEGVTLQELMDEDNVIQECKLQNKKLVEFLCQREVLEELVNLITVEPSEEIDERARFKYPNIACELLTCDVPSLNETLSGDNELLEKLYSFLEREPPLNPLLASFLSRTLGVLIVKRIDQAMGFLKEKDQFINLLLKHLATSAIMDLTLKLITEVGDEEHRQNLLNWLDSQNLIQSLVALFDPKVDCERHYNASQLLCDVLRISREATIDHRERDAGPILARLESPETVSLILDNILGTEKSESSIVGGIQILLALLDSNNSFNECSAAPNNVYDDVEIERKQKVAESTALVIVRRLKDFHQILYDPPKRSAVKTSVCQLDPPLGNTRLQVTRLLAALIANAGPGGDLVRELMALGTVETLLDLFFKYVWNNFLHAQVELCLSAALAIPGAASGENIVYAYLVVKCRLLGRILEAWDDNEQKQTKPKGVRQGYMGHLINIANNVVREYQKNDRLDAFIKDNVGRDTLEAWQSFVSGPLSETNKTQQIILGGIHPSNLTGDDGSEDYAMPYPQSAALQQQLYHDYQLQQTADLVQSYSFHGGEFEGDPADLLDGGAGAVGGGSDQWNRQAEIFKKVCNEYINTLDDADDSIFEEAISGSHVSAAGKLGAVLEAAATGDDRWDPREDSSDEDESPATVEADPWDAMNVNRSTTTVPETNPWSNAESSDTAEVQDGWADFGSFSTDFPDQSSSDNDFTFNAASGDSKNKPSETPPVLKASGDVAKKETATTENVNDLAEKINYITARMDAVTEKTVDILEMIADVTGNSGDLIQKTADFADRPSKICDETSNVSDKLSDISDKINKITNKLCDVTDKLCDVSHVTDKTSDVSHKENDVAIDAGCGTDSKASLGENNKSSDMEVVETTKIECASASIQNVSETIETASVSVDSSTQSNMSESSPSESDNSSAEV